MIYSGIYKIINPKGKVYIGESQNIFERKQDYVKGKNIKGQVRIYRSIKKYGWGAHTWEVVELCCIENLKKRERFWQDFYNVIGKMGLNCKLTRTDEKSAYISEETRANMSRARIGYKPSEETLKKMSEARKGIKMPEEQRLKMCGRKLTEEHKKKIGLAGKGRIFTEEWKKKMSISQTGKKMSEEAIRKMILKIQKPVIQYNLEGNFIKEWKSAAEVERELGISSSTIAQCCKKKAKSAGNFKWEYADKILIKETV